MSANCKANLRTLGVNLQTIAEQQGKLLLIGDKVTKLENDIQAMRGVVAAAEVATNSLKAVKVTATALRIS